MKKIVSYIFLLSVLLACRQAYEPPAITAPNRYLVVEGVINTTPGASTVINLSRTRNLVDTFIADPERSANVRIESRSGSFYNLFEQNPGMYVSGNLNLNSNDSYRLIIRTNGKEYTSDFVQAKITPPIDSLSWRQDRDVTIYASTHDPSNNARYYRWDFTETWQYRAEYEAVFAVQNDILFGLDPTNQQYNCWWQIESSEISLATSTKLSQDVIDRAPITIIPRPSSKIGIRYSILVRQYALTEDAYKYWEILQKNTESTGTLFDAQPGQLQGNIHNTTDATEPVLGYASASSVQEKRLFISNTQLTDWDSAQPTPDCSVLQTPYNPNNFPRYGIADTAYAPYYFANMGTLLVIARKFCLDCRLRGGTNQKPSFW